MGGSSWPALTAGAKAKASDVEAKFDWLEADLVPMLGGFTTDAVYSVGTTTARWSRFVGQGLQIMASASAQALYVDRTTGCVGIGTVSPNTSSALDISATKALLFPRLTTAERGALTPTNGMTIYNSTDNIFEIYQNGAWIPMASPIRSHQRTTANLELTISTITSMVATANVTVTSVTSAKTTVNVTGVSGRLIDNNGTGVALTARDAYARLTSTTNVEVGVQIGSATNVTANAFTTTVYFEVIEYY